MPVKGDIEFFGEHENEHLTGKIVFSDDARAALLRKHGYTRDMASNRRALFISPDIVSQLVSAPDNPFAHLLRNNGWGTVLHRGGDTSVGGFQQGKNSFQVELVDDWLRRSSITDTNHPEYISEYGDMMCIKSVTKLIINL